MRELHWLRDHRTLTTLLLVGALVAPGYYRQETQVDHLSDVAEQAQDAAADAKHALALQKQQTDTARKIACDQQNVTYDRINSLIRKASTPPNPTPTQQARIDAAVAPFLLQLRDCTPEGIADYYRTQVTPTGDQVVIVPDPPAPVRGKRGGPSTSTTTSTAGRPTTSSTRPPVTSTTEAPGMLCALLPAVPCPEVLP